MSTRRVTQLFAGLILFGVSIALMVRAELGLASWDVLHQGLAERTRLPMGWVINGTAVLILLVWIPLRQRPGLGTIANVIVVGIVAQLTLEVVPAQHHLAVRGALLAMAIVLNGIATGLYVGAGLGPGPRDGLMTGLAARGLSLRKVRTAIELIVTATGWLLGGTVGVGTILFAFAIGPLVGYFIPKFSIGDNNNAHPQRDHRQHSSRPGGRTDRAMV